MCMGKWWRRFWCERRAEPRQRPVQTRQDRISPGSNRPLTRLGSPLNVSITTSYAFFLELFGGEHAGGAEGAEGDEHRVGAPFEDFGLAEFDGLMVARDGFEARLRVADRRGTGMAQSEVEHGGDVEFVAGGHHHHVWEEAHIGNIEGAMVRRAVGTGEAGAVEAEGHRE